MTGSTMAADELAQELRRVYGGAPRGDKVLYVQLFAITYADELGEYQGKVQDVVRLAEIGDHVPTINDARKLAWYVTVTKGPDILARSGRVDVLGEGGRGDTLGGRVDLGR